MFCRYCGQELDEGTPVCTACGKKTVKLRPRLRPEEESPPVEATPPSVEETALPEQETREDPSPFPAFEEAPEAALAERETAAPLKARVSALITNTPEKLRELTEKLHSDEEDKHPANLLHGFDVRIWTVCGVLLGLAIISLVEYRASIKQSNLLFSFLKEIHPVWLLATFLNMIIILVTVIRGYRYRHSPEYLEALRIEEEPQTVPDTPVRISTPEGVVASEENTEELPPPEEEPDPNTDRLSPEAEDIIAELQKLSFDL